MNAQRTKTNCIICGKMATIWAGHLHINTCSPEMCVLAGRCDSCNNLLKNCEKSCYTEIISTMRNGPVDNCPYNGIGCYGYWMDSKDKIQPSSPKLTIHFSQCTKFHGSNLHKYFDLNSPVEQCIKEFTEFIDNFIKLDYITEFSCKTYLEHHILMAQQIHRQRKLSVDFIYYCSCCYGPIKQTVLRLDDEGDFIDDVPHGFFGQRLSMLTR